MKTRAAIRKYIVFMLLLLAIFCVSACQPTPEKEIVQQRDDFDELVQKTAQPTNTTEPEVDNSEPQPTNSDEPQPTETIELVQKYQDTFKYKDGVFKVVIDAVVDKWDVGVAIPVVKVEPYLFTQEDADRAVEVLLGNDSIYEYDYHTMVARETFQKKIIQLRTVIAKIKGDTKLAEQTRNSLIRYYSCWIDSLEILSADASVDIPEWKPVNTEFVDKKNNSIGLHIKADMGKVWPATLNISVYDNKINSTMSFGNDGTIFVYDGVRKINDDIQGLETTFVEALELAEDTIKRMGIKSMKLDFAEFGVPPFDISELYVENTYIPKCYIFNFTPEVNGLQVHEWQTCSGFEQEGATYGVSWRRERIWVAIDDSGVIGYSYGYPGKITKTINDNVNIKDFKEIMAVFEKQIFYEGSWTAPDISFSEMTIKRIQMSLFRLKLKDKKEYLYVPVWDFIGTWKTNNYETQEGKEYSFLTINAIDGSIINRNRGY